MIRTMTVKSITHKIQCDPRLGFDPYEFMDMVEADMQRMLATNAPENIQFQHHWDIEPNTQFTVFTNADRDWETLYLV